MFFKADATFGRTLDLLAFDSGAETASVVMHPQARPVVEAGHVGEITTRANILGAALQLLTLGWAGGHADSVAVAEAEQLLSDGFYRRLSSDVTATINLRTGQFDFVFQALAPGVAPTRPFAEPLPDGDRFVVNEQQELRQNMPHIVGPIEPAAGAIVDFVAEGAPVRYRVECRSVVEATFGPALDVGQRPALPRASPTGTGVISGRESRSIFMPCPWYLLTEADAPTRIQVRVHGVTSLGPPAW